jgi:hypothetical protein
MKEKQGGEKTRDGFRTPSTCREASSFSANWQTAVSILTKAHGWVCSSGSSKERISLDLPLIFVTLFL